MLTWSLLLVCFVEVCVCSQFSSRALLLACLLPSTNDSSAHVWSPTHVLGLRVRVAALLMWRAPPMCLFLLQVFAAVAIPSLAYRETTEYNCDLEGE